MRTVIRQHDASREQNASEREKQAVARLCAGADWASSEAALWRNDMPTVLSAQEDGPRDFPRWTSFEARDWYD